MNQIREENFEEKILDLFQKENISTIILAGKAGIGKTWMARKITSLALKEDVFDFSLFVSMSIKQIERALYYSIACQLSICSTVGELGIDGDEEAVDTVLEEMDLEALKNMILSRFSPCRLLLILDNEGKKLSIEDNVITGLLHFLSGNSLKVLITSLNEDGRHKTDGGKIVMDLKPLRPEKSLSLLQQKPAAKYLRSLVQEA